MSHKPTGITGIRDKEEGQLEKIKIKDKEEGRLEKIKLKDKEEGRLEKRLKKDGDDDYEQQEALVGETSR